MTKYVDERGSFRMRETAFAVLSAIVMLLGAASHSFAANHYIRAGATGINNGSDWTNAWTSFAPVTWTRGDTYYVAGGTYNGNVTIPTGESGTSWITIKKANVTDNAGVAGWDPSYATTQAVINGKLWAYSGYFELDGVTGSGTSGHGIKIHTATSQEAVVYFSSNASPHHVHHVELLGPGYAYGSMDSDGLYYNSAATGSKGLHVSYCWIHEIPRNGVTIGNVVGTSYSDFGMLFENNVLGETGGLGIAYPGQHGQGMQLSYARQNAYTIIRNNVFKNLRGSGFIVYMDGGATHRQSRIYNNLFYVTDLTQYDAASPSVITILPDSAGSADGIFVYNNTFYNIGSFSVTDVKAQIWSRIGATNIEVKNNLWTNSNFTSGHYQVTSLSNNGYFKSTGSGVPSGEVSQQTGTEDPYVNSAAYDFRLRSGSNAVKTGLDLSGVFNTDFAGNPRPTGSAWDIGAYQFIAVGADVTAPSTPVGLAAVAASSATINLTWQAATDDVGVTDYWIYRNATQITRAQSVVTNYSDTGLAASTTYTYTVRAVDGAGNVSVSSANASATTLPASPSNTSPVLASIGNKSVNENATLTITMNASDPDGDPLSYAATGLPAGASFDDLRGVFSWTPGYDQGRAAPYSVTFTVSDGKAGGTVSETIAITVVNVNRAPTITAGPTANPAAITVAQTSSITVTASDPDLDALTFAWSAPANGGTITGTGSTVVYTPPGVSSPTTYTISVIITDSNGGQAGGSSSITVSTVAGGVDVSTGLVGWWKFDEMSGTIANDSSGRGHSGTLVNGPAWVERAAGNGALLFDGISTFVNIPSSTDFDFPDGFTISAWVNSRNPDVRVSAVSRSMSNLWHLWTLEQINGTRFDIEYVAREVVGASSYRAVGGGLSYSPNAWHHVVGVKTPGPTDVLRIYIDGSPGTDSLVVTEPDPDLSGVNLTIGSRRSITPDSVWNGYIDDVRIYNRALSATEVAYLASAPLDTTSPVVGAISSDSITGTGGTITWTTDEPSSSQIDYGTSASYGSTTLLDTSLVTNHSVAVTGLANATTYYYRVRSRDAAGNEAVSSGMTFTTLTTNRLPTANPQFVTTSEDTPRSIVLTATDPDSDELTYFITLPPSGGTLSGSAPNLTYTPAPNYSGPDSVAFKVNDGAADSNIATVAITISPVNDAPILSAIGSKMVPANSLLTFTLNATDNDSTTLSYSAIGQPSGSILNTTTRVFSWTPSTSQVGSHVMTFSVTDGSLTDSEVVSITVTGAGGTGADITTGLSGWWQFNEVSGYEVTDSSGNGNTGFIRGYPKRTTWPGSNGALGFDGGCEFVKIPYSETLRTGTMSIAAWMQVADILKLDTAIFGWGRSNYPAAGCPDNYYGFIRHTAGWAGWYMTSYINDAGVNTQPGGATAPAGTFSVGGWSHYVTVYNADDDTIKLYKSGVLVGNYAATGGIKNCGSMTAIGSQEDYCNTTAVRGFSGKMADYRVYTRALSDADVFELYNATKPTSTDTTPPGTPTGLTATASSTNISVTLSWNAASDNVGGSGLDGYIISRSTSAGGTYTDIASVQAGTTTWTDHRHYQSPQYSWYVVLLPSTTYYYKVKAIDTAYPANISSPTSYVSATTIAAPTTTYSITVNIVGTFPAQRVSNTDWNIACTSGSCVYSGITSGAAVLLDPFLFIQGMWQPSVTAGFNGWSGGGCQGKGPCLLNIDSDKSVTAYYGSSYPPDASGISAPRNLRRQ